MLKIDHHFTDRKRSASRYGYDDFDDPDPGHDEVLPGGISGHQRKINGPGARGESGFQPDSKLLNSFTFGFNRIFAGFKCTGLDDAR